MKALKTIQTLSKVGKVLSTIVFVCSIIGICGCFIGLLCLMLGGSTVADAIESTGEVSLGTIYASIAVGIILCVSEIILSRLACLYFKNELDAGTPFTFDGAKELLRLGITAIWVPAAAMVASYISLEILGHFFENIADLELNNSDSLTVGIAFVIISFIFKYGAELAESKKTEE